MCAKAGAVGRRVRFSERLDEPFAPVLDVSSVTCEHGGNKRLVTDDTRRGKGHQDRGRPPFGVVLIVYTQDDERSGDVDSVTKGERVDKELDAVIRRRHDKREAEEGHRPSEEAWAERLVMQTADMWRVVRTREGRGAWRYLGPAMHPSRSYQGGGVS